MRGERGGADGDVGDEDEVGVAGEVASSSLAVPNLTDREGNVGTASATLNFHVLTADINPNRIVDFADLLVLAQNYGQTGRTFSPGNFDYSPDGLVGFSDLLILAQRYGTSLIRTEPKPSVFGSRSIGRRGLFEPEEAVIV